MILITGGARSGKSTYALEKAEQLCSEERLFVATCPSGSDLDDPELAERIARHQQERGRRGWRTIEEQQQIGKVIASDSAGLVLVDCLTLWVNNILFAEPDISEDDMTVACEEIIAGCRQRSGTIILVTNEVGMGIVPENILARRYRDLVGRCNQEIAAAADKVFLVTCGIPMTVKEKK